MADVTTIDPTGKQPFPEISVGIGEMKSAKGEGYFVAHSLGSCVGLALYENASKVGVFLHFQLPMAPKERTQNPLLYADTGIMVALHAAVSLGANKRNIHAALCGAGDMFKRLNLQRTQGQRIGVENLRTARKILWREAILIQHEDVSGDQARTVRFDIKNGRLTIKHTLGTPKIWNFM